MITSPRFGVQHPSLDRSDSADVPRDFASVVTGLEKAALYGQGTLAARPVSTAGVPGKEGRIYVAVDLTPAIMYYDYGTGWYTIGAVAAGAIGTVQLADRSVTAIKIAVDTITATEIAPGAVGPSEILDGSVAAAEIANALKPSAGAGAGTETLRALGTAAGTAAAGSHAAQHLPGASDSIDWIQIHRSGTLAGRPAASAGLNGIYYWANDVNGGTLYQVQAAAWQQVTVGLSQSPVGAAGGMLRGTYPNPDLALNVLIGSQAAARGQLQLQGTTARLQLFDQNLLGNSYLLYSNGERLKHEYSGVGTYFQENPAAANVGAIEDSGSSGYRGRFGLTPGVAYLGVNAVWNGSGWVRDASGPGGGVVLVDSSGVHGYQMLDTGGAFTEEWRSVPTEGYQLNVLGGLHYGTSAASSDKRMKKNVSPLQGILERVLKLAPVTFEWNKLGYETGRADQATVESDVGPNIRNVGLIAQDVQDLFPELVSVWDYHTVDMEEAKETEGNGKDDGTPSVSESTGDRYLGLQYDKLAVVAIAAIQELTERVASLEGSKHGIG